MPVVPISKARGQKAAMSKVPPPAEPFALMAAALMHQERHLVPEGELLPQLGGKEPA